MTIDPRSLQDDIGPAKIVHLHDAKAGLDAILVVDNVACGPAIGGCRMAPDVTLEECFRLARAMTLKNAAAGLAHGGGKSVIRADPAMPLADKQRLVRAFARAIGEISSYIVGPDMGTDETAMAWCVDEIGRAVGLPAAIGGIPLDEIGATGYGLRVAAEVAAAHLDLPLAGARIAVQGFGSVGRHAARFLAERGARVVAVADSRGATFAPDGLDLDALLAHKAGGAEVARFAGGAAISHAALISTDCDILVPAARPDVLRADNQAALRARLVLPGANIAVTAEAETLLHRRGVLVLPDFIVNAGGVICAAVELRGGTQAQALATVDDRIRRNTGEVLARMARDRVTPREAASALALARVRTAMALRR